MVLNWHMESALARRILLFPEVEVRYKVQPWKRPGCLHREDSGGRANVGHESMACRGRRPMEGC